MDVADGAFAVHCGTLFDGTGSPPRTDQVIVVRNGRYEAGTPEPELPVLDLSDHFVMPGLVDAHAHLSTTPLLLDDWPRVPEPDELARTVPANLRTNLSAGTTTMRVMGEKGWLDADTRAAIASDELVGPNLVIATRAVTASTCAEIDSADDVVGVRRIVRENFDRGADFVKIHLTEGAEGGRDALFSHAAIAAAVDEARRHGSYVAAHAHGGPAVADAVALGVRSVEHGFELSAADIAAMVKHDTWLVSTLAFDFEPHGLASVIDRLGPDHTLADLVAERRNITAHLTAAIQAGVRIAFGSNHLPGSMGAEIRLAIGMGMTTSDALVAATAGGADLLGMSDRIGSIVPGRNADLLALLRDPFTDPDAFDAVALVMKDGTVQTIEERLAT